MPLLLARALIAIGASLAAGLAVSCWAREALFNPQSPAQFWSFLAGTFLIAAYMILLTAPKGPRQ